MSTPVPIPVRDAFTDKQGRLTRVGVDYLQNQSDTVSSTARTIVTVEMSNQTAAIGTTAFNIGSKPAGWWRVTYYLRVQTAASISSSVAFVFSFTDTTSPSVTSAAVTGNTNTSVGSASFLFYADANTAISYSTTYASNAAGMAYKLGIILESLS